MAERIVINTGPLITLHKIEALEVVAGLPFEFICPVEVSVELAEGEAVGHPRVAPEWLTVISLRGSPSPLQLATLDLGETAVIQLALEQEIPTVCIDEWKARRVALACGLKVVGVLGLLGKAKQLGIITSVRPLVEKAISEGIRYDLQLLDEVLKTLGE